MSAPVTCERWRRPTNAEAFASHAPAAVPWAGDPMAGNGAAEERQQPCLREPLVAQLVLLRACGRKAGSVRKRRNMELFVSRPWALQMAQTVVLRGNGHLSVTCIRQESRRRVLAPT